MNTFWFQLEDMFQLIVTPQGIEKVMIQLIDTPTKVYAIEWSELTNPTETPPQNLLMVNPINVCYKQILI